MCIRDSFTGLPRHVDRRSELREFRINRRRTIGNDDQIGFCLLYTSDAADERSSVDLGGRRIIKKKNTQVRVGRSIRERN